MHELSFAKQGYVFGCQHYSNLFAHRFSFCYFARTQLPGDVARSRIEPACEQPNKPKHGYVIACTCRVLWLVLVLTAIGLFTFILVQRFSHYVDHPARVNVEILYTESLPFPAVTVCNQNFLR